jgi:two-component system sensor histidine kinase CpxA
MSLRFPLYAKILLWFFLNLVVLALAFYLVVKVQLRVGLDSLLAGRAGDRLQAVAEVISAELGERPRNDWEEVLERFSKAYHVQFFLFRNDGVQLAGSPIPVPPEVHVKLNEPRAGLGPARPRPPPPRPEGRPGPFPDDDLGPWPPGPGAPRGDPPLRGRPAGGRGKFMVRTESPTRYWVGLRIPLAEREHLRAAPATLLAVSDSLRGGGLFFDVTPWIIVGFGAVFFSVLFWVPLVRGITRSVSQMTQATAQIAEGHFDVRVASRRHDELGSLAAAINQMAARLAGFVTGQKRFLGDIAHELCAPIARLQMALGILEERADDKQRAYVEDVREEVQEMSGLVNELLSFSKASLRHKEIALQPVPLAPLARRVVAREASATDSIQVQIPEESEVLADPDLLARALANLLRNALRYASQSGPILVTANTEDDYVTLSVSDSGPGVPEVMLHQIFDPFFRLEPSRSRDTGGVGLGLAIVKTCIEACQGTVHAQNRQPTGLQVSLVLKRHVMARANS